MKGLKILLCILLACNVQSATYKGNYALSFDGLDDLITWVEHKSHKWISIQPSYQDEGLDDFWTLEAWIKPAASQQDWQLNLLGFPARHPNLEYCGANNGQCAPGAPLTQLRERAGKYYTISGDATLVTPDVWHHVSGTWDNSTLSLFVDGTLAASINPYQHNFTESRECEDFECDAGLQIGGFRLRTPSGLFSGQYFRGLIDEVRVWKIGRTQQEIISTMAKTLSGSEPGLQYYWRFDEGSGNTVKSHATDGYGLLGGGQLNAAPRFIISDAPILASSRDVGNQDTIIIEKNSPLAVAAGAMLSVFFLFGGICIGIVGGWKIHEKRHGLKFAWESEGLSNFESSHRFENSKSNVRVNENSDEIARSPQEVFELHEKGGKKNRKVRFEDSEFSGSSSAPGAKDDTDDEDEDGSLLS